MEISKKQRFSESVLKFIKNTVLISGMVWKRNFFRTVREKALNKNYDPFSNGLRDEKNTDSL